MVAAKNFEIMSSGGLLFTNNFVGIKKLFPKKAYCSYENDFSDVQKKAKYILTNPQYVLDTIEYGLEYIKKRHTHLIRINQLLDIIENLNKKVQ